MVSVASFRAFSQPSATMFLHQRRIVEVGLRALADRRQLAVDRVDHRLLAFEAADARRGAALLHPFLAFRVGIDLVQFQTGHFSGLPGSVRFTRAGSVGMVLIFFATDSGSSRRAMVLP